ncbi:MAG: hypothetical protein OXT49_05470 [Gammaproteobacteria bacterium]|nr:hypothetical protein [Gammaproteobacteria bacterium]
MKTSFPDAYAGNEVAHMMFRANHIYLLLSAAIHGVLGLYLQRASSRIASKVQTLASLVLITTTGLFLAAFFLETAAGNFERPMTYFAVVFTVVAMGMLCLSALIETRSRVVSDSR